MADRLKKASCFLLVLALILSNANMSLAYTDLSTYQLQVGNFTSENEAKSAAEKIKNDTGWQGTAVPVGDVGSYYRLVSGGFKGETVVKDALALFQKETGYKGSYEATGNTYPLFQITTGGFKGEDRVKDALTQFTSSTGISARYESTGNPEQYYRIESGGFKGLNLVSNVLQRFKDETGIGATYESTGKYELGRQLVSGGFKGEEKVKQALADFKKNTGFNAIYEPTGTSHPVYEIISGGYKGEAAAKKALAEYKNSTGLEAVYESTGRFEQFYQIVSGGFEGQESVKQVLQEFTSTTGISGEFIPTGEKWNFYSVTTGGFGTEQKVKTAISDVESKVKVKASYEKIPNSTSYRIVFSKVREDVLAELEKYMTAKKWWYAKPKLVSNEHSHFKIVSDSVNAATRDKGMNFFRAKGWYASSQTGEKVYTFNIKSSNLSPEDKDKGLSFFQKKGWWAAANQTGEKLNSYRIKSDSLSQTDLNKALDYFSQRGWWATSQATNEKIYSYIIKTGSIKKSDLDKGLAFFENNGWWAGSKLAEKIESFRIKTDPITEEFRQSAFEFFNKEGWWASSVRTGELKSYRIKSGDLVKTDAEKALEFFTKQGWWATIENTGKQYGIYHVTISNVEGRDKAEAAAERIKSLYGWNTKLVKTKNGPQLMYTDYGMTLDKMLQLQMANSPQTDKYRNEARYIHADYVDIAKGRVTGDAVNVRTGPSTAHAVTQQVNSGTDVLVIRTTGEWVEVRMTWQDAKEADVKYYLNPNNFSIDNKDYFQFLKLSKPANLEAAEVNQKVLKGKGILEGRGQAFIDAANRYNINEVYLISHALLETGNGTSSLAKGIVYNGRTVYNMYGYGAYDSCPESCGAKTAYENGWFTPEAAIIGGAQFISSGYIYNEDFQQDTLYKMRWNPVQPWHQYATDIGWAYKQVNSIYNLYQMLDNYTLYYDVPKYLYD